MNEFVEECRREWKRLGVSGPVADEMAADLSSDLRDAEADGVSADELLGPSAADPRAFAAAWAAERGVVPEPAGSTSRRKPLALMAFTAVVVLALIFAAVALATGEPKLSIVARTTSRSHLPAGVITPPGSGRQVVRATAAGAAPVEWILLVVAVVGLGFAALLWSKWPARGRSASLCNGSPSAARGIAGACSFPASSSTGSTRET